MYIYVTFGIGCLILYKMNYLMDEDKVEELKQLEATQFITALNSSPLIQRDQSPVADVNHSYYVIF